MRRDYIENMKASGFQEFNIACQELKNSKYVLAENKIAALLKSIADNKQLYSMFAAALYGFDYKSTFDACARGNGLILPTDARSSIALVFRILIDIDSGKMPFGSFLESYFYSESINESFARFILEMIVPFETYCKTMFAMPMPSANANNGRAAGTSGNSAYSSEQSDKFQPSLMKDALECVITLKDIADSAILGQVDRAEFNACLDGLTRSINNRKYNEVISAFLGVKYAVMYFFKSTKTVLDIYKKLEYDIKHLAD